MIEHVLEECQCEGKQCSTCEEIRCIGWYAPEKRAKSGLVARCRICQRAVGRAYYQEHPEKYHDYNHTHVEQINTYKEQWAKRNPEKVRESKSSWKKRNPEKVRKGERKWNATRYSKNPEYFIERSRAYKQLHPEYNREYAQKNPEIIRTKTANRRARRKNAIGKYTVQEWKDVQAYYDYTCLRCGKQIPEIKLTPDHVIPLSREGTNLIDNIQPLCLPCNVWKRKKIIDYRPQWKERKERHAI